MERRMMRKAQFGNLLVDIAIWVVLIGIVAYLVYKYVVMGGASWLPSAGEL